MSGADVFRFGPPTPMGQSVSDDQPGNQSSFELLAPSPPFVPNDCPNQLGGTVVAPPANTSYLPTSNQERTGTLALIQQPTDPQLPGAIGQVPLFGTRLRVLRPPPPAIPADIRRADWIPGLNVTQHFLASVLSAHSNPTHQLFPGVGNAYANSRALGPGMLNLAQKYPEQFIAKRGKCYWQFHYKPRA
jgi:hypothetical protein